MVRLCDKEVYTANLSDLTRGKLFTHFCKKGHNTDIIMVYGTGGKLEGYISYDMLLKNNGVEACIERCRVTLDAGGDNLFRDARNFFDGNPEKTWLLVCNENGEPECFAYNDTMQDCHELVEETMKVYETCNDEVKIQKAFPEIRQAWMYGCNEWAYRFKKILEKQGIEVKVIGNKWKLLHIEDNKEKEYPDYEILNIYAEGTQAILKDRFTGLAQNFEFLRKGLIVNCRKEKRRQQRDKVGKNIFICQFPSFNSLKDISEKETFRNRFEVCSEKKGCLNSRAQDIIKEICGIDQLKFIEMKQKQYENVFNQNRVGEIPANKFGEGRNAIYLVGPCIAAGLNVLWDETLMFCLQKLLEEKINGISGENYYVLSMSINEFDYIGQRKIIESIRFSSKDILIYLEQESKELAANDIVDLDLKELYNARPQDNPWFFDTPIHTTKYGNKAVAEEIFKKLIEPAIEKMAGEEEIILKESALSEEENDKLKTYLSKIKSYTEDIPVNARIGSIVMNCNPFTLGHRYLIEEAAAQVDYLFVFVVEEDKSVFPFEKRMEMVKRGTGDLKNVRVYPSGEYILSNKTMPAYFEKEILQEVHVDASRDIGIFSNYVAPELHISVRFAGTEPLDQVTEQYNREMERTLKKHGIDFVEIPRKEQNGKPISASLVRALLGQKDWKELEKLVPKSSFFGLKEMYPDLSNEG